MNILLLSQFFSTTRGGGEYVFSLLAKNLSENGHKVWVITNKISGEDYKIHDNINLVFVKPDLEYKGGLPPSFQDNIKYMLNTISSGLKMVKKEKIDIIHSNNFSPAIAGSILSYLTSKPHITSIWDIFSLCGNDYWDKWTKQIGVSKIHSFLGPRFEKLILNLPHDAIHTISEASQNDLTKFGAKKPIYMIPPTIEESKPTASNFNSTQFVYVGRLVFYKNIEVIIKAIKIVIEVESKIKLVIVGGGPHEKILKDLVLQLDLGSNVQFMGYVATDEKE
ncbi:MAG: glycosyltransferase, partial [Nitrosotalea sp.]